MKLFFFILVSVVVVQVSVAAPFLRYKRDNEVDSSYFVETFDEMKTAVRHIDTLISNTLKEIPERQVYATYIASIQNYLNEIQAINYTPNYCYVKTLAKIEKFGKLLDVLNDKTRESNKLDDILEEQGMADIIEELKSIYIKLETIKEAKLNDEESYKTGLAMTEVC